MQNPLQEVLAETAADKGNFVGNSEGDDPGISVLIDMGDLSEIDQKRTVGLYKMIRR